MPFYYLTHNLFILGRKLIRTVALLLVNMATSLNYCDDFEEVNEPLPELRWHIEVHETNYQFTKQIAVKGDVTIGQLTFAVVKEIGKNLVYFSIVFKMMFNTSSRLISGVISICTALSSSWVAGSKCFKVASNIAIAPFLASSDNPSYLVLNL